MRALALALCLVALSACGGSGSGYSNQPAPPPSSTPPTWAQVKTVLDADCETCHNGSSHPALEPQTAFCSSPVTAQLDAGTMPPPPATISDSDKATLLDFQCTAAAPAPAPSPYNLQLSTSVDPAPSYMHYWLSCAEAPGNVACQ